MARAGVQPMTLAQAQEAVPPQGPLQLPEGSWGEGGDHRVWLNSKTEWTWDRVYSAEQGPSRYSMTVVDYSQIEKILTAKAQ